MWTPDDEDRIEYELFSKLAYMKISLSQVTQALKQCHYDSDKALALLLKDADNLALSPVTESTFNRTTTSLGGARLSIGCVTADQTLDRLQESQPTVEVNEAHDNAEDALQNTPETPLVSQTLDRVEESQAVILDHAKSGKDLEANPVHVESKAIVVVKEEPDVDCMAIQLYVEPEVEMAEKPYIKAEPLRKIEPEIKYEREPSRFLHRSRREWEEPQKKKVVEVKKEEVVVVDGIENGDFLTEADWLLIGDGIVTATSTTKRRRIENNEVVEFEFPLPRYRAAPIVRLRNKRLGEIGRLPMDWSKCLIPLAQSGIVKARGKCVNGPLNLDMMREITLYMGFYAHKNFFAERENKIALKMGGDSLGESNLNPLRSLFQLLKIQPLQEAMCTAVDLESRKRPLTPKARMEEYESNLAKRQKGQGPAIQAIEQKKDENAQSISEATLNKLVGTVEVQNLEEMQPPSTLTCDLRPYQKQALHWMTSLEDLKENSKTLHPCWAAYQVKDENAVYVNVFSGEMTTKMPSALENARGGILADAMGLGKTVMTIALLLARPGKGIPDQKRSESSRDYCHGLSFP